MNRRNFVRSLAAGSTAMTSLPAFAYIPKNERALRGGSFRTLNGFSADLVIAGGGLGGCAAALAALRNNLRVVMTEETDWIGGQLTQQGVPPDEHQWIETHGATRTWRSLREKIRDYYRRNYPLTAEAKERRYLNPGDGAVSRLCHEPKVALAVLLEMMAPYLSTGKLTLLTRHKVIAADTSGDRVAALQALDLSSGERRMLHGAYIIDATELGDLLPLTGTAYRTGTEPASKTGELHAPGKADPLNLQAFTLCFAMDYVPGADHVTDKPREYDFWRNYVPEMDPPWSGTLLNLTYSNPRTLEPKRLGFHPEGVSTGSSLNLWNYRRIIHRDNFRPGTYPGDITVVNWPQNDYVRGNLVDVTEDEFKKHVDAAAQLNLSLLYWLQTEAPRPDGGQGWPGLRLRPDIMGTADGMAKYPYVRESRRIESVFTVLEEHVGAENRLLAAGKRDGTRAAFFHDSVGVGYYHIDLHPSSGGNNYIDFSSLPFQIPLGALLPVNMENLLPACKNIGTTHITNGCYRLHPVEWNIGESAGMLAAFALQKKVRPHAVRGREVLLEEFQQMIRSQGVETSWPEEVGIKRPSGNK